MANNSFATDYIDVAQRIADFRAQYPDGSLQPANLDKPYEVLEIGGQTFIVYAAAAYRSPDDPRPGIGMAYEAFPGRSNFTRGSELQNAETSAWGRAIVAALAGDTKRSIASAEEVRNRQAEREQPTPNGVQSLKSRVWKAAKSKGWSQSDLEDDFAASHDGLAISSADESQLEAYAKVLEAA